MRPLEADTATLGQLCPPMVAVLRPSNRTTRPSKSPQASNLSWAPLFGAAISEATLNSKKIGVSEMLTRVPGWQLMEVGFR